MFKHLLLRCLFVISTGRSSTRRRRRGYRVVLVTTLRPCHTQHAVPLPCRAAKGLSPFDLHSAAVSDSHLPCHAMPMPCSDHAVLLKATTQHVRRETACGLPARFRLLPANTRSSTKIVIRSIPILLTTIHTYDCKEW